MSHLASTSSSHNSSPTAPHSVTRSASATPAAAAPHNGIDVPHDELHVMRHSAAHVLAKAVQRLYPGSKLGIGPVIENGFYYDIDIPAKVSEADLPRIEEAMQAIVAADEPFERLEWSKEQALAHYSTKEDNPYKREIIEAVPDGEPLS